MPGAATAMLRLCHGEDTVCLPWASIPMGDTPDNRRIHAVAAPVRRRKATAGVVRPQRACLEMRLESRLQAVRCGNRLKAGLQTLPHTLAGIFQTRSKAKSPGHLALARELVRRLSRSPWLLRSRGGSNPLDPIALGKEASRTLKSVFICVHLWLNCPHAR